MSYELPGSGEHLTFLQDVSLYCLCARYEVPYDPDDYQPGANLPKGWVAGWLGGESVQASHPPRLVACAPDGAVRTLPPKDGDA